MKGKAEKDEASMKVRIVGDLIQRLRQTEGLTRVEEEYMRD